MLGEKGEKSSSFQPEVKNRKKRCQLFINLLSHKRICFSQPCTLHFTSLPRSLLSSLQFHLQTVLPPQLSPHHTPSVARESRAPARRRAIPTKGRENGRPAGLCFSGQKRVSAPMMNGGLDWSGSERATPLRESGFLCWGGRSNSSPPPPPLSFLLPSQVSCFLFYLLHLVAHSPLPLLPFSSSFLLPH